MEKGLPGRPGAWSTAARIGKVKDKTIHDIDLTSASAIGDEQYLMLRVLWQRKHYVHLDLADFGLEKLNQEAADMLKTYRSWSNYCNSFSDKLDEGTFALARFYQKQIPRMPQDAEFRPNVVVSPIAHRTRGRTKNLEISVSKLSFETPTEPPGTPIPGFDEFDDTLSEDTPPGQRSYGPVELLNLNYPKTKDEQIVNAALIDFLNAFIIHFGFPVYWTLYRKSFTANFKNGSFEARTDGCLESVGSKIYAIVEAKPMLRFKELDRISMQEAAEMVAWIKCDPDPDDFGSSCGRRILISQDRHEIYLTFAEYSADYVKYLNGTLGPNESPGFLMMYEFGPWDNTERVKDMKHLSSILLAIVLRARAEYGKLESVN
ncbi:hypothetical protein FQN50_002251 [Emmonsiellopsis sp. PD_5]|nr:hypothetical protein FQN50_002251 [Emmonsiellopsis sp. PD_5]